MMQVLLFILQMIPEISVQFACGHTVSTNLITISDKLWSELRCRLSEDSLVLSLQTVLHLRNSHHRALRPPVQKLLNSDKWMTNHDWEFCKKVPHLSATAPGNTHTSEHRLSKGPIRCTHPSKLSCKTQLGKGDTLHQREPRMGIKLGEEKRRERYKWGSTELMMLRVNQHRLARSSNFFPCVNSDQEQCWDECAAKSWLREMEERQSPNPPPMPIS